MNKPALTNTHRFDRRVETMIRDARVEAAKNHSDIVVLANAVFCLDCKTYVKNPDGECTAILLAKFRAA